MSLRIEFDIHFDRKGRGARKVMEDGPKPTRPSQPGRVPRVARLMALAIRFERMHRDSVIESYTELAVLGHVTRPRISQIMNLLNLALDIQEAILFLPRTERGRDPIHLRQLQPIAGALDWRKQRIMWAGASPEPVDPRPSDQDAVDLASDLVDVLARLPDDLCALAERLKGKSVSQAARDLGVPRSTLQRQVQRLRRCFEDAGLRIYF